MDILQRERLYKKLDDDSLDAICEVMGEGLNFAYYNKGKSAMREWFLRRLRLEWDLPEPKPEALGD
jgi:hypothetical protein